MSLDSERLMSAFPSVCLRYFLTILRLGLWGGSLGRGGAFSEKEGIQVRKISKEKNIKGKKEGKKSIDKK